MSCAVKMRVMRCYYAHPMTIYNTPQEERDILLLGQLGFVVVNPNAPEHSEAYGKEGMKYFMQLASECDVIAFRALPDGSITAGVANEIKAGPPVFELPSCIARRTLNIAETLEALHESGQR
jgi:hypothetical protein